MKILFVHLSDLHIADNFAIRSEKNNRLLDAIKSKISDTDHIVIICSGDLAYRGKKNEYKKVKRFFGFLLSNLGKIIDEQIYFFLFLAIMI